MPGAARAGSAEDVRGADVSRAGERGACGVAATNSSVVPADAGTHNHRKESLRHTGSPSLREHSRLWLWVPDRRSASPRLSGTTVENLLAIFVHRLALLD